MHTTLHRTLIRVFLVCLCLVYDTPSYGQLRLMSYNIRSGSDINKVMNLAEQTDIIRRWAPDYVMLQEVDSVCTRSGGIYEAGEMAEALGMHATYAPTISKQGGKYGIALMSRQRPLSVQRIAMPNNSESRVLLICEFEDFYVACTHLSYRMQDHKKEAKKIIQAATGTTKPFFIGGDWNAKPHSRLLHRLRKHFTVLNSNMAYTFPADKPNRCIDYIAVYTGSEAGQRIKTATYQCVVNEPTASDHRPLIVDIEFAH